MDSVKLETLNNTVMFVAGHPAMLCVVLQDEYDKHFAHFKTDSIEAVHACRAIKELAEKLSISLDLQGLFPKP